MKLKRKLDLGGGGGGGGGSGSTPLGSANVEGPKRKRKNIHAL